MSEKNNIPPYRYFSTTKDLETSLFLILPLFVIYQVGLLGAGGVRNGVDFVTDGFLLFIELALSFFVAPVTPFHIFGSYVVVNLVLFGVFCVLLWRKRKTNTFQRSMFGMLLAESTLYAILLGGTVHMIEDFLGLKNLLQVASGANENALAFTPLMIVVQSVGAGLYEEVVFRAFLFGGIIRYCSRRNVSQFSSVVIGLFLSSFIFSAVHHLGALGDDFTFAVFSFRFFAGALLGLIFYSRGLAVAVYTHAIYDVIVMTAHAFRA